MKVDVVHEMSTIQASLERLINALEPQWDVCCCVGEGILKGVAASLALACNYLPDELEVGDEVEL